MELKAGTGTGWFSKWTPFEKILLLANILISFLFFGLEKDFGGYAWIGLVSSISNVICVIYVAKRSIFNYYWGTLGVITYAIIAYHYANTGEWMLNALYYLPMQFVGLYAWNRSVDQKTFQASGEVLAKRMSLKNALKVYALTAAGILAYAYVISLPSVQTVLYGAPTPNHFAKFLVDSATTIISVVAMILMVKRYQEQWTLWIVVNIFSIILWIITFNPMMIIQWTAFLINSIYGYIKWNPNRK